MSMVMVLKGGIENHLIQRYDAGSIVVQKMYSLSRKTHDGCELYDKYCTLLNNESFNYLSIKDVQSDLIHGKKTINSIIYDYIPGNNRWVLQNQHCEQVANYLFDIHNNSIIKSNDFQRFSSTFFCQWLPCEDADIKSVVCKVQKEQVPKHIGFVHGDFHPGNILWDRGALSGVLDWDNCHVGNILFDIATIRFDLALFSGAGVAERFLKEYEKIAQKEYHSIWFWDVLILNNQSCWKSTWFKQLKKLIPCSQNVAESNYRFWREMVISNAVNKNDKI